MINKDLNAALEERCNFIISRRKESFEESKKLAFKIWKIILKRHESFNESTIIVAKDEPFFSSNKTYFRLICENNYPFDSLRGFSDVREDNDVFDVLIIIATHSQFKCEIKYIDSDSFPVAFQFTFH